VDPLRVRSSRGLDLTRFGRPTHSTGQSSAADPDRPGFILHARLGRRLRRCIAQAPRHAE
jgi:hypothetical protein